MFSRSLTFVLNVQDWLIIFFCKGALACWHCDKLRVSEDLQSSVSPPSADQMGQI